ncbi:signal recognition particle protein [Kiloniella sp. b19]|uniref:signal recognition particle protein n=1 Tax=Kiloniella sp. GXU_MW_B19 TaxID=3141326 RepID=UPI0031DE606E
MFESLQERLGSVFEGLTKRGSLSEADVTSALREVRVALLEADVALPVVKDFVEKVKEEAVDQKVLKSITPGQMVIKIVNDKLTEMLGSQASGLNLSVTPPAVVMMVGLQGSGKTTSTAKISKRLTEKERKKVLMASLDVRRPAAQQQLQVLGLQTGVRTLNIVPGEQPVAIAKRAVQTAALEGFDVVMLDTAGRLAIDEELMAEVVAVRDASKPTETLLVADAMTGQDAVTVAETFNEKVGLSGIVMTRMDGDARGGAALSMRAVTGCPIKLMGVGEKLEELEDFHPDRVASRILGMGDVVSLVEKAAEHFEEEEAEKLARKMQKGTFDLNDLAAQLKQMQKMGGLNSLMGMLPGMNSAMMKKVKEAKPDDRIITRQLAIISSMTPKEREKPEIIKAKRKIRIANGCGLAVQDVNKLLKQHQEASRMMKKVQKMGKKGMARGGLQGLLPPGFGGFPK